MNQNPKNPNKSIKSNKSPIKKLPTVPATTLSLLAATIITVTGCLAAENQMSSTAQNLQYPLTRINTALNANDWQQATITLKELEDDWQQQRRFWLALITHQDVANIDTTLLNLTTCLDEQQLPEAKTQLALLNYYINAPVEANKLGISTIF